MDEFTFKSLPISEEVQRALTDMGFEEATPIQMQTIPYILENRDLLGQAQTGTGKTCAFGIPVIDSVDPQAKTVQTIILSPTRELAIQIAEELHNVAQYKEGVRIVAVYGGQPIDRQIMALKRKPQIIVGTPGRVMDHMRRKTLRLDHLEKIVLDEADEMLNMGFKEDIDTILSSTPENIQKIFFSATMPRAIVELTNKYLTDPIHVKIASKELTIPLVEQFFVEVREGSKVEVLSRLIDAGNTTRALVFCNTKRRVDELADRLNTRGYSAEALHGDMKQASRDRVMKQFKSGKLDLLIATDVAARGIDVDDVEVVFNFDLPSDEEYYVHRVGRTGRAGKSGKAYSFVVGREIVDLKNIQRAVKATITRAQIPTLMHVTEKRVSSVLEETNKALEKNDLSYYVKCIDEYVESLNDSSEDSIYSTASDVAAALLKQLCGETMSGRDEITEVVPYEEYASKARTRDPNMQAPTPNMRNHGKRTEEGMQRLFLNIGIKEKVRPNQIVQFIASKSGITGSLIGAIAIFEDYTFVDVPKDVSDQVVEKANNQRLGRIPVHVELKRESAEEESFSGKSTRSAGGVSEKKYSDKTDSVYPDRRKERSETSFPDKRKDRKESAFPDKKKVYAKDADKASYPKKRRETGGYERKTEYAPKKDYGSKKKDPSDKVHARKKREE